MRFILALLCLFASTVVAAGKESSAYPSGKEFHGAFAGVSVGYGGNFIRLQERVPYLPGGDIKIKTGAQGYDAGVLVGYSHVFDNNWGSGIQANFNWAHIVGPLKGYHTATEPVSERFVLENAVQIRIPLFYVVDNRVTPKIFAGWDSSYWSNSINLNKGGLTASNKSRFNGVLWGFGADFLLEKNLIMGLEYAGIISEQKTFYGDQDPSNTFSMRPEYHTLKVILKFIDSPGIPQHAACSYTARALPVCQRLNPKSFQGFYVGMNAGYGAGFLRTKVNVPSAGPGLWLQTKLGAQGADGGLIVGYHYVFENRMGMGLESYMNIASIAGEINGSHAVGLPFIVKSALKNAVQVRLPVSYVVSKRVAPKVYAGWDNSYWSTTVLFKKGDARGKKRYNGVLWGIGVDFLLMDHVISGFEYTGVLSENKLIYSKNGIDNYKTLPLYHTLKGTLKFIY